MSYHSLKRGIDIFIAFSAMTLFMPVMIIIAATVRIKLGKGVLFSQVRPGLNVVPFRLYKFRTMRNLSDAKGDQLPDAARVSKFGNLLRSSSLDELPGLINVLRGDMSIVGPRPLLMEYVPLYTAEQSKRHLVRPGITGWAQVNGRNMISWEKKFELDIEYVENLKFSLDLKIILLTVKKVFLREGITDGNTHQVGMEAFTGSTNKNTD